MKMMTKLFGLVVALSETVKKLLESNFVSVLVYLNRNNDVKRFKEKTCYLPKCIT